MNQYFCQRKAVLPGRLVLAGLVLAMMSALVPAQEAAMLETGQAVEREITGGQKHTFRFNVLAGQFARVQLEQKGVDVTLALLGGDGAKLAEIDSPNGRDGAEELLLVTAAAGELRLEVTPGDAQAATGRYFILLAELRTAGEQERRRAAADAVWREGIALYVQNKAETYRAAAPKFVAALEQFQQAGDKRGEARCRESLGQTYSTLGERAQAVAYYQPAIALWHDLGDTLREAEALNNIGTYYIVLGVWTTAAEYFHKSLPLCRALGEKGLEGVVLNNLGVAYQRLGELQKALESYLPALALIQASKHPLNECIGTRAVSSIYFELGDQEAGAQYLEQSLPICRNAKLGRQEGNILGSMGMYAAGKGDYQKARELLTQSLAIEQKTGNQSGQVNSLFGLGRVQFLLGDYFQARDYYSQSLALAEKINVLSGISQVSYNLGLTARALGQEDQAQACFTRAQTVAHDSGDAPTEANALRALALLARDRGDLATARAYLESALPIIENTRQRLRSPDLRTAYFAARQDFYELYTDVLMRQHQAHPDGNFAAEALQATERGRARTLLETLVEARADIRAGIAPALLAQEKAARSQMEAQAMTLSRLLAAKYTPEQKAAAQAGLDKARTAYRATQNEIRAQSPRYAALTQPAPLTLAEIRRQVLDDDTLLLEYALGQERSYLWAVTTNTFTAHELPHRAAVETAARRVYDLLTARNKTVKFETVAEKNARLAQAAAEYPAAAAALSRMLLGPVAAQLNKKRLLIVADGALQYIPFSALPAPAKPQAQPLVASHEIVSLPSASTLAVLRQELAGRQPAPLGVAVLADPVFDTNDERFAIARRQKGATPDGLLATRQAHTSANKDLLRISGDFSESEGGVLSLPRLAASRREANAIAALAPPAQRKAQLDFAANLANATDPSLSRYRLIHFATHGFLDSARPELSGLVFSLLDEQGQPQAGFLRAHEIYNLNLPADLVVLSACRTGLGKEIRGEGLVGLTRGFMYAGAARVAVSLWDVNDVATAELMTRFYRKMLGPEKLSPAAALRAAQASMATDKRWAAPYYWAGFVLQGEPR